MIRAGRKLLWLGVRGVALAVAGVVGAASAQPPAWDWHLTEVDPPKAGVQIFDTDPDLVTPGQVAALKAAGIYTICYVSVGTVEDYRTDVADFPAHVIGKRYGDWPDERFLDIRRHDVLLPLMAARFARCKAMGFDAVEPDNLDLHEARSGFDISAADVVAYVSALRRETQRLGLGLGQKNVPELTPQLEPMLDFILMEGCFQHGFCDAAKPYVAAGKPALDVEYNQRRRAAACAEADRLGVSMIFKRLDLDPWRRTCDGA